MLEVVSGRYHPALEAAFAAFFEAERPDAFEPIAVVSPSARLLERTQLVLAERGLSVVNVHFHTFASLAEAIVAEEAPLAKPILSDPLFYDTLVRQILREDRPFAAFEDLAVPRGFPSAVRSTLRDLLDAGIDEENVEAAVREEFAGRAVDLGTLRSLLQLYRLYLRRLAALPVAARGDLVKRATELAPRSRFLKGFGRLLFYGFYDLTGLQSDFFQAIAKAHSSRLFFPYAAGDPAYAFAARFRDNFLQPVMGREESIEDRRPRPPVSFTSVSGRRDEAWLVAGEIERLHREKGVPYADIAVIARSRERLGGPLPAVLRSRAIPFRTTRVRTLADHPQTRMALDFLSGDANAGGDHRSFREFRANAPTAALPDRAPWRTYAAAADAALGGAFVPAEETSARVWKALRQSLSTFEAFDALGEATRREFLDALRERWQAAASPLPEGDGNGVSLLHAEAARGLSFRAVFLVGAEERVFPRLLREDPFLRDDARMALNQVLGHKIGQKMTALEEERLLFELILESAVDHLAIVYQRTDDDGAVVGASPFVRALAAEEGTDLASAPALPRPAFAKLERVSPAVLGPAEVVTGFLAAGRSADAVAFARAVGRDARRLERGLALQAALQRFSPPGAYDGLVPGRTIERYLRSGRLSPTTLESFARCPFRFFATRVLELEPRAPETAEEALPADVRGKLVHGFLERFYRAATADGTRATPPALDNALFDRIFDDTIGSVPAADVRLHPVLWSAVRLTEQETLRRFVAEDLRLMAAEGWRPVYFEHEVTGAVDGPLDRVGWSGRLDRVDVDATGRRARVVDYKTGRWRDRGVATEALRGRRLQAPLYLRLARSLFGEGTEVTFSYLLASEESDIVRSFTPDDWKIHGPAIIDTVETHMDALGKGHFVMMPEAAVCAHCDVAVICRKDQPVSVYRTRRGPAEALWATREKKGAKRGR